MIGTLTCLSGLLATVQFGMASRFGEPGDMLAGYTLMCRRHMTRPAFLEAITQGCAHRWLPCGTRLLIVSGTTGRHAACTVVDRGPYGALHQGRWLIKRRAADLGTWRGILDLLPPVANRLRLNGLQPVLVRVLEPFVSRPAPPRRLPIPPASRRKILDARRSPRV